MRSKYLEAFKALQSQCPDASVTVGDVIWVEELKEEEIKTASGIIISEGERKQLGSVAADAPMLVHVLAVGKGYYDDEGEDVPVEVQPGDIALVGKLSVNWVSTFGGIITKNGPQLGFTRESEIKHYWKGQEGYAKYFEVLRKQLGLG
jgi:co-chaperonin GroES (HSP10)